MMKGRLALLNQGMRSVKVSSLNARLKFIECGPTCIATGCTAKCCDAPTHPDGMRVFVDDTEAKALRRRGATVTDNFIRPAPGTRGCPFKDSGHLCSLHFTPDKPFGCVVSPFALNANGTLIVRNRYKLLPCYDPVNGQPAYRVFQTSLVAIFGEESTSSLCKHLDNGGGDIILGIDPNVHARLAHREKSLRAK